MIETPIMTPADLARQFGRHRSTVGRWFRRHGWPVPGWPDAMPRALTPGELVKVVQFVRMLQYDRNYNHDAAAKPDGPMTFQGHWFADPTCPCYLLPWLGQALFSELTPADLDCLAEYMTQACAEIPDQHEAMNRATLAWTAGRFRGRQWWLELAKPTKAPPASWLTAMPPLPHRRQRKGSL